MKAPFMLLFWLVCFPMGAVYGQNRIQLDNPSFEEQAPRAGKEPSFWIDLGDENQTPADVQPGFFGVTIEPQHGRTYLGLVVRENNTWEGVGQKLDGYLRKDTSYTFSLWLTRSITYKSAQKLNPEIKSFTAPTILKIWGYNTKTKQEELLAESQPVSHSKWVKYEFVLKPSLSDFDELDLMAYYAPGHEKENGNLLVDNCSAIVKMNK